MGLNHQICINIISHITSMFDQNIKYLIQTVYPGKVIVFSNYKIRQTLWSKGITPSIFLHQYYAKKSGENKVFYKIGEKGHRELCDILPIDAEQYQPLKAEKINKIIKDKMISSYKMKTSKEITKESLLNKEECQNFLRSMHFSWFQEASRIFLHYLALDQQNYRHSTLEQPLGFVYMIQILPNMNIKSQYQKIRKDAEIKLKKMFILNGSRAKLLPILIILLYDTKQKVTYNDAQKSFQALRYQFKIDMNLICIIQLNSPNVKQNFQWSNYNRPILNINFKLQPGECIKLLGDNQEIMLKQYINNHRDIIRMFVEKRLTELGKKYEDYNTAKNKIFNFFKGSSDVEKSYNQQEIQTRQIGDILFLLGDYKRSLDIYKTLVEKFQASSRDQFIFYNLSEMIQISKCLNFISNNFKDKTKVYDSLQKYAEKTMLGRIQGVNKLKVYRYLIYYIYFAHCFKIFNKDFIKGQFYYYIKKYVNQENGIQNVNCSIIPSLIHEQYANINLLFPIPQYRRYAYDLIRVASKFSEYRLFNHQLRCLLITEGIYKNSFSLIQKYIYSNLCKVYFQMKNHRESIKEYKNVWMLLLTNRQQICNNSIEEESQFTKFQSNYKRLILEVQKIDQAQLQRQSLECISIPKISNNLIQILDQKIENKQKIGSKWQEVGDIFLERPELTSKGMNKQNMLKMLKLFDASSSQQKELAYRIRNLNMVNGLNEAVMKRNSRNSFINEPILFTFDMKNILPNSIEIQKVHIHLKTDKKCTIKLVGRSAEEKISINPQNSISFVFEIIPHEAGLYQFSHISWLFSQLKSIHAFKEPWETKSQLKSLYYKINVIEQTGRLKSEIRHNNKFFQGQLAEIELIFENQGVETITQIYLAVDHENIFGFKMNRFEVTIQPKEKQTIRLQIKIPLFQEKKHHQNFWKCVNKFIFLYKTGPNFRVQRLSSVFNINRVAQIYNISCERISTNLHFLSFLIEYQHIDFERNGFLKSLVIDGDLEIKKIQKNLFGLNIVQYFFFLRKNPSKTSEEYKFSIHGLQTDKIIDNYKESMKFQVKAEASQEKKDKISLYFIWNDKDHNFGIIHPAPILITPTENTDSKIKLPFSVKLLIEDDIQYDFQANIFLQLDLSFSIKNIFDAKTINVCIDLIQNANNDFYWQGITQHVLNLRHNQQKIIKMKLIIFRPGIYNIAKNIKYIISINKANSYPINHFQYENVYIMIRDKLQQAIKEKAQSKGKESNFDFFEQYETNFLKKSEKEPQTLDLI